MKKQFLRQKMLLLTLTVTTALHANAQKVVTVISNKENNYCNGTCTLLNIPELNNNPDAIIMVTPMAKISHPMTAYYVQSKKDTAQWSILNLDNTQMQVGTQFSVEYYVQPDTTHFLHVVTQQNLQKTGSYIDHAGLNDNPNAQIKFFQNLAPIARGGVANNYELKIQYDTVVNRWYMFNTNNRQLSYGDGYNITFSPGTLTQKSPNTGITSVSSNPITALNNTAPGPGIWITVTGQKQGLFYGESGSGNKIRLTNFEMEMLGHLDPASGLPTGKKQYTPIVIQKVVGPSSLQFIQALINNENLITATLEMFDINLTLIYKIKLTNAIVTYCKQSVADKQNVLMDIIKLTFQKIEFDYSSPAIQVFDLWNSPTL